MFEHVTLVLPRNGYFRVLEQRMAWPPLMDGDFWIEEAVRWHATSIARHLKGKPLLARPMLPMNAAQQLLLQRSFVIVS